MPNPRASGLSLVISRPSNWIVPESGSSKPAIMRNVVVLPHPDGPSNPKNSPCSTSRETAATAVILSYRFEMLLSERRGIERNRVIGGASFGTASANLRVPVPQPVVALFS